MRNLLLILGDQLDLSSPIFKDFNPDTDKIWMAEADEEISYIWTHQYKITFFLSAMRHFRDELTEKGLSLIYHQLGDRPSEDKGKSFKDILKKDIKSLNPEKIMLVQPGDFRVMKNIQAVADQTKIPLEILEDPHFYYTVNDFKEYASKKKSYLLESFYRKLRKEFDVLMDGQNEPEGGDWNYDKQNRETFSKDGPEKIKTPRSFQPDDVTSEVMQLVKKRYGKHPGSLESFDLPVSRKDALAALRDFIHHRLEKFGSYQDAMWTKTHFLYHSRLSALMNIKLLSPKEVIEKVTKAYHENDLPLNSVEGFVRQVLGWREFMRGIYWKEMPEYLELNFFNHQEEVPHFFWDGKTEMVCVRESMQTVIEYAYAHHIQRLMVLGLFAQLWGVHPKKFHEWHMAMYNDAIDWVSLPNALGMSQYGDGGIVATKPYVASGNYINRMSNYCGECKYRPGKTTGEDACPFSTLYWDFLSRNRGKLEKINRMNLQMRNLKNKKDKDLLSIKERATYLRNNVEKI